MNLDLHRLCQLLFSVASWTRRRQWQLSELEWKPSCLGCPWPRLPCFYQHQKIGPPVCEGHGEGSPRWSGLRHKAYEEMWGRVRCVRWKGGWRVSNCRYSLKEITQGDRAKWFSVVPDNAKGTTATRCVLKHSGWTLGEKCFLKRMV